MIITFVGHSLIPSAAEVKEAVKKTIQEAITHEPVVCYLGGYGDFDTICAYACKELKQKYTDIEVVYVAPYISLAEQEKIKNMQSVGLCDTSVYPPLENTLPKFAILKRNEWMIAHADVVIAYVNHSFGGAYRSLRMARRANKKILSLCNLPS